MTKIPPRYIENIADILERSIKNDLTLTDVFPEVVGGLLQLEKHPQYEWTDPNHELVAISFEEHATEKEYDQELINMTLQFWSDFCKLNNPNVQKVAGHTAALDYFSQVAYQLNDDVTQAKIATEYETSSGTVSTHYRRMADGLDEMIMTVHEE